MMILNAVQKKNRIKNTFKVHYDFLKKIIMCYLLRLNNIKIFQTKYFFFVFNERKQKTLLIS